jgi:hypothetical protein
MEDERSILEEIARIVSRRGQTIYGRAKVIDVSGKTGVILDDEEVQNSKEELLEFLKGYSRLGPASPLTLSILALQNGLVLPEDITTVKKRFSFDIRKFMKEIMEYVHELDEKRTH